MPLSAPPLQDEAWTLPFVLFTWLGVVVLAPFSLLALSDGPALVSALIARASLALASPGRVRDAAALCLAHALARSDLAAHCTAFLGRAAVLASESDVCTRLGVLAALASLVSRVSRAVLAPHLVALSALLDAPAPLSGGGGALERRARVKLSARVAVAALLLAAEARDVDASALDAVSEARLGALLEALRDEDTRTRESAAASVAKVAQHLSVDALDAVASAVLALLVAREAAHTWHGALLAVAHLVQRALLVHRADTLPRSPLSQRYRF